MSAERLNPSLTETDVDSFVLQLDALPTRQDFTEIICSEMVSSIKDVTFTALKRAITDLGALRKQQYHRIPLSDARYEILLNFDRAEGRGPADHLRVTTNEVRQMEEDVKNIQIHDYAVGVHTLSVAHRQSSQILKGGPTDLLPGTLPIIWPSAKKRQMGRFVGPGYRLDAATPLDTMNFQELTQQLETARALSALLGQLHRDVTMEGEYPY